MEDNSEDLEEETEAEIPTRHPPPVVFNTHAGHAFFTLHTHVQTKASSAC